MRRAVLLTPLLIASKAQAAVSIDMMEDFAGFSTQDLKVTLGNIVKIIIGFLGIITVLIILWGGFRIMVSRGNPDEVAKGKKIIVAGVIGLLIGLASYAITVFLTRSLQTAV